MITSSKNCTFYVVGAKQSTDLKEDFIETYIPTSKLSFTDAQLKAFLSIFCNKMMRNVKILKLYFLVTCLFQFAQMSVLMIWR